MSRNARIKGASGIYHVMLRGNEKKDLFHDFRDRNKFLNTLAKVVEAEKLRIYSYCLMRNHVHILLHEGDEPLSVSMKRIETSYAYFFNKKYGRVGHLFQDRFCSQPVEGDQYLLAAARYIHNNPVSAGIIKKPEEYEWSSFRAYLGDDGCVPVDKEFLLALFSDNIDIAVKFFIEFSLKEESLAFIDTDQPDSSGQEFYSNDNENKITRILKSYGYEINNFRQIKDKLLRDRILKEIKQTVNISVRDLSDILGIGKDTISRA